MRRSGVIIRELYWSEEPRDRQKVCQTLAGNGAGFRLREQHELEGRYFGELIEPIRLQ